MYGVNEDGQGRNRQPRRGVLVEFVRLIIVAALAAAGYAVAKQGGAGTTRIVIGIVLGSAVGYVAGGILGRGTAAAMHVVDRQFRRTPVADLVAAKIEIDPMISAAPFGTAEDLAVKMPGGGQIVDRKSEMKRGKAHRRSHVIASVATQSSGLWIASSLH